MYIGTAGGLGAYRRGFGAIDPSSIIVNPNPTLGGAGTPMDVPCTCIQGTCLEDGNSCSSPTVPYQYTGAAAIYCEGTSPQYDPVKCNNLYVPSTGSSFTAWLNQNSTLALGIGAVVLGMAFLSGGRR